MPAAKVSGFSVAYTAVGGLILWSGIAGTPLSVAFKGALAGKSPSQLPDTQLITAQAAAPAGPGGAAPGDTGASDAGAARNQATAKVLAAPFGWSTGQQWADLVSLWNRESGWNTTAVNPTSGATGIPQLNPSAHTIPPGWSSATVQISWGLAYIAATYGSPAKAWQHETEQGWY